MGAGASILQDKQAFFHLRDVYESENLREMSAEAGLGRLKTKFDELQSSVAKKAKTTEAEDDGEPHLSAHEYGIGDVVRVNVRDGGTTLEGVITSVCKLEAHAVVVDFGDGEETVDLANLQLVLLSTDFEVDDCVECMPPGYALYFRGHIIKNNHDKTFDVKIDGDDPDDIEYNVPHAHIRKLMTGRNMASLRLHKTVSAVKAINAFRSMGKFHAKALDKMNAIKLKK